MSLGCMVKALPEEVDCEGLGDINRTGEQPGLHQMLEGIEKASKKAREG